MYSLVTGASGVLGREFCFNLAKRGENLFLTGRNCEKLDELKNQLTAEYPLINVKYFAANLENDGEREELLKSLENIEISRLVNCAGADIQKPFKDYDEKKLLFQIRATFEAAAHLSLFCIKRAGDRLSIINISSVCGEQPMPYFAVYAASKSALTFLSEALFEETRGTNVKVTAVLPGSVYTREDVKSYIRGLGFFARLAAKTPEYVVKKSLKAADKGKRKVILGGLNKAAHILLKFVPRAVQRRFIARKWEKSVKDAF